MYPFGSSNLWVASLPRHETNKLDAAHPYIFPRVPLVRPKHLKTGRTVRNPYPYILFRFPVVSVLLAVCHDCQLANLYWQLAERQSSCSGFQLWLMQLKLILGAQINAFQYKTCHVRQGHKNFRQMALGWNFPIPVVDLNKYSHWKESIVWGLG